MLSSFNKKSRIIFPEDGLFKFSEEIQVGEEPLTLKTTNGSSSSVTDHKAGITSSGLLIADLHHYHETLRNMKKDLLKWLIQGKKNFCLKYIAF